MYDPKYFKNMLSSVLDTAAPFEKCIRMYNGPYLVVKDLRDCEGNPIIIPKEIIDEYNHLIQKEYNSYRKDHYTYKDPKTNEYNKPRIISLEELTDNKIYEYDLIVNTENDEYYVLYQSLDILSKKNPLYHKLIILHFFEKMNFLEIAEETGITRQTVSVKVKKAKNELKKILEGIDGDE